MTSTGDGFLTRFVRRLPAGPSSGSSRPRVTVLVLCALMVAAGSAWFLGRKPGKLGAWLRGNEVRRGGEAVRAQDSKVLEEFAVALARKARGDAQGVAPDSGTPAAEAVYAALVRTGNAGLSWELLTRLLPATESALPLVRAGLAVALGCARMDPEARFQAAVRKLLNDGEALVRAHALRGVSCLVDEERKTWVRERLAIPGLSERERALAFTALYRLETTSDGQAAVLGTLRSWARREKNSSAELAHWALIELMELAPGTTETAELMRSKLELLLAGRAAEQPQEPVRGRERGRVAESRREAPGSGSGQGVSGPDGELERLRGLFPTMVRHLAAIRDPWLLGRLDALMRAARGLRWQSRQDSRDFDGRRLGLAVIDAIHLGCPLDRWTLLSAWLESEPDPELREALLREPARMPSSDALALLRSWKANRQGGKGQASDPQRNPTTAPVGSAEKGELATLEAVLAQVEADADSAQLDPCLRRD
jgi:hypothetical protein